MSFSTSSSLLLRTLRRHCEGSGGISENGNGPDIMIGLGLDESSSEMSELRSWMSESLFEVESLFEETTGRHFLRI